MVYAEYTWIFVVSLFVGFFAAFGIGANDVANSFGSSVGSKAITMWQAVIIAGTCEFTGALLLGAGVTDTIKGGIAKSSYFADQPAVFLYGFFCVLIAAAFWDNFACHLELPVSTTHTTVGAVVGFALVAGGGDAVIWSASKDNFPFFTGFVAVIASWVVSPVCSGTCVLILFGLLRTFVLRSKHSFVLTFWLMPLLVGLIFGLIVGFIMIVGAKNKTWENHSDGFVAWVSAVFAVGAAIFTLAVVMPLLKRKVVREEAALQARIKELQDAKAASAAEAGAKGVDATDKAVDGSSGSDEGAAVAVDLANTADASTGVDPDVYAKAMADVNLMNTVVGGKGDRFVDRVSQKCHTWADESKVGRALTKNKLAKMLKYSLFYDVHNAVRDDKNVAAVWSHAEVFDFKTERLFRYLQVFSAMAMSFAHGSNDVANAMGPMTAVYQTWQNSAVPGKKVGVPKWILAYGGAAIVVGLATFGYKIMRVLGVKSVKMTNARGFCCEYATALTVCIASRYGLPVSTTQVVTGAILATGLFEGRRGVNWRVILRVFGGWVLTLFVACGVSALFTALGLFTPNLNATNNQISAAETINTQTLNQIQYLNSTTNSAALQSELNSLNATLTEMYAPVTNMTGTADLQAQTFDLYNTTLLVPQ